LSEMPGAVRPCTSIHDRFRANLPRHTGISVLLPRCVHSGLHLYLADVEGAFVKECAQKASDPGGFFI